jgi:hypothetical protein
VSDPADDSPADILALAGQDDQGDQDLDQDAPAEVVPLPIFNAREEAAKWW